MMMMMTRNNKGRRNEWMKHSKRAEKMSFFVIMFKTICMRAKVLLPCYYYYYFFFVWSWEISANIFPQHEYPFFSFSLLLHHMEVLLLLMLLISLKCVCFLFIQYIFLLIVSIYIIFKGYRRHEWDSKRKGRCMT